MITILKSLDNQTLFFFWETKFELLIYMSLIFYNGYRIREILVLNIVPRYWPIRYSKVEGGGNRVGLSLQLPARRNIL